MHFFNILTSKSGLRPTCFDTFYLKIASRHNGVQFFMFHVASYLRTRRFSEPTFRPSGATKHWENLKCGVKHERNTYVSGRCLTAQGSKQHFGQVGAGRGGMDALDRAGWDEVALAGIADLDWEEVKRILEPVTGRLSFGEELQLKAKESGSEVRQRLDNTSFARRPVGYFVDTHWARRYGSEAETPLAPLLEWERIRKEAPVPRWPTRFQRALDGVTDGAFRSELEAKERKKIVARLADFMAVTGLWRPDGTGENREGAELARQRFAMGRRMGTLRQHLRNAEKISRFCIASYDRRWIKEPQDFFDLVAARLSEPCGRHVPRALLTSIGFIEQAAEVVEELRISRNPGVRNFLREIECSAGWQTGRITKKASPFPLMVALSLEDLVMRKEEKNYVRWYAWVKLVKLWAALRWDDVQGIPNPDLVMRTYGTLAGRITRSKTSGLGKKVEVMNFYVTGGGLLSPVRVVIDGLDSQRMDVSSEWSDRERLFGPSGQ